MVSPCVSVSVRSLTMETSRFPCAGMNVPQLLHVYNVSERRLVDTRNSSTPHQFLVALRFFSVHHQEERDLTKSSSRLP